MAYNYDEVVVAREGEAMDVEMVTGVKMAVNEGDAMSIEKMMETVAGLAVGCGSVSGGVSVAKVRSRMIGCALGRIGDGAAS